MLMYLPGWQTVEVEMESHLVHGAVLCAGEGEAIILSDLCLLKLPKESLTGWRRGSYNIIKLCSLGQRRTYLDSSLHVRVRGPLVQVQFKSLEIFDGTDCINGDDLVTRRHN